MIEQNENTEDILMDTVLAKLNQQDEKSQIQEKRMLALENNFIGSSNLKTDIITIKADLRSILENERQLKWADGKMQELNKRLDNVLTVLSKPPQSEAHHHHHFPAILWATAGLFLVLCLVSSGWLMTSQRMEQFKTNCRF